MSASGITTRDKLLAFFSVNPDETLTTTDVADKYGISTQATIDGCRNMRKCGLLDTVGEAKPGKLTTFKAGPALLGMIR